MKKLELLIEESSVKVNNGISIDNILKDLKDEKIPPGICTVVLKGILNIDHTTAQNIVFASEHYKAFGKMNDDFLDMLTKE